MTDAVASVRVYGLAQCDTCRKARKWLERFGVSYQFVDYRAQPIAGDLLKGWAQNLGWDAMINRAGTTWRTLSPARKTPHSDAEWVLLLRDHPALMRRPVVVVGDQDPRFGFSDSVFKRLFAA